MQEKFSFSFCSFWEFFSPSIDQNNILTKTAYCTPWKYAFPFSSQQAKKPQAARYYQRMNLSGVQVDFQITNIAVTAPALYVHDLFTAHLCDSTIQIFPSSISK